MESFEIISKKDEPILRIKITNTDLAIVNSLRRIILSEVPTVGFYSDPQEPAVKTRINVKINTGLLHNEFIAHRISLVPLHFDENEVETYDPNNYTFRLKIKNDTTDEIAVTTEHLVIYDKDGKKVESAFQKRILPPILLGNPKSEYYVLLTKLKPNLYDTTKGEELDIECTAQRGTGAEHARWSPVSLCTFYNSIDEVEAKNELDKLISKDKDNAESIKRRFDTLQKQRYYKKNQYGEPSEFIFSIESECGLPNSYIFLKALQILSKKVSNFIVSLDTTECFSIGDSFYQLVIHNENYTLLNLLHSFIYNTNIRETAEGGLTYIGTYQPHPLDSKMFLKVKFNKDKDERAIKLFLAKNCEKLKMKLEELTAKWVM